MLMSEAFEKAWYDNLKRNPRDRPELGTVSLDGITAYPTVDKEGNLFSSFDGVFGRNLAREGKSRVHNVEAFRNIDSGSKHSILVC